MEKTTPPSPFKGNISIEEQSMVIIMECLKKADPTGIFTGFIQEDIAKQWNPQIEEYKIQKAQK